MTTTSTSTAPTSVIRHRDEAPATWFLNGLMTSLAATEETAGAYSITEHLVTSACTPPVHVQVDEDEAFYVVEGRMELEVDGRVVVAGPGTFALVARGSAHTFRPLTDTVRMLVICSGKPTDNLEEFFLAMGDPATERVLPVPSAPDLDRLGPLAARAGIEFV